MGNKRWYLGVVIFLILLLVGMSIYKFSESSVKSSNSNLDKYRSASIPQECRLPQEQDLTAWKEHLGHHAETKDCLKYYE